jgi:hypothetical protein
MRTTAFRFLSFIRALTWFFEGRKADRIDAQVRRFRGLEPMRLLAAAAGLVFLLLLAGLLLAAVSGSLGWQAAISAAVAVLIVALGLLYAWRLGAPGRRE